MAGEVPLKLLGDGRCRQRAEQNTHWCETCGRLESHSPESGPGCWHGCWSSTPGMLGWYSRRAFSCASLCCFTTWCRMPGSTEPRGGGEPSLPRLASRDARLHQCGRARLPVGAWAARNWSRALVNSAEHEVAIIERAHAEEFSRL